MYNVHIELINRDNALQYMFTIWYYNINICLYIFTAMIANSVLKIETHLDPRNAYALQCIATYMCVYIKFVYPYIVYYCILYTKI